MPDDKRPPRNLWDKPFRLKEYMDKVWDVDGGKSKSKDFIEFDMEDVE